MPRFPAGTGPQAEMGDHVMGVVVLAWLTEHALRRWGPQWAAAGGLDARFRAHLTAGVELIAELVDDDRSADVSITDAGGTVYATASMTAAPRVAAVDDAGIERPWVPLSVEFDAERDLAFTERMSDGRFWREHGWAHPAWLASASNAIVLGNCQFASPGDWRNAGLAVRWHQPIPDGSIVTLTGGVVERFGSSRFRFAVAAIAASVGEQGVATLRNTYTYHELGTA